MPKFHLTYDNDNGFSTQKVCPQRAGRSNIATMAYSLPVIGDQTRYSYSSSQAKLTQSGNIKPTLTSTAPKLFERSFSEPNSLTQWHKGVLNHHPKDLLTTQRVRLQQAQTLSQALREIHLTAAEKEPIGHLKAFIGIQEVLQTSIELQTNNEEDYETQHQIDYCIYMSRKIYNYFNGLPLLHGSRLLRRAGLKLEDHQNAWRQQRYQKEVILKCIKPWLEHSSKLLRAQHKQALSPITRTTPVSLKHFNPFNKHCNVHRPLLIKPNSQLNQSINCKADLGRFLQLGYREFVRQYSIESVDDLTNQLKKLKIPVIEDKPVFSTKAHPLHSTQPHLDTHTEYLLNQLQTLGAQAFCCKYKDQYNPSYNAPQDGQNTLRYLAEEIARVQPKILQVSSFNKLISAKPKDPKFKEWLNTFPYLSKHELYEQINQKLHCLTLTRGMPAVLRGNIDALINQGKAAVEAINQYRSVTPSASKRLAQRVIKIFFPTHSNSLSSNQFDRNQRFHSVFHKRHSVHNTPLAQDLKQESVNTVQGSELVKENAKLGGNGLNSIDNPKSFDALQEPVMDQAADLFGFTEAIAGFQASINKITQSRNRIRQLKSHELNRQKATEALTAFARLSLNDQVQQLPYFYNELLKTHKGVINAQTLYSLIVEMSDAWLGTLRYGTNVGINSIRLVSDAAHLATGASLMAEAAETIAPIATASSTLAFSLSTAKAVKNGLNLRQRIKTHNQYRLSSENQHAPLIPIFEYALKQQHALMPHYVDFGKEAINASAYGVVSGVGIASFATGSTALGVTTASGIGAAGAALAATGALGAYAYHRHRLYKHNKALEEAAKHWRFEQQEPLTLEKTQEALLAHLPNLVAELLVRDLKNEISMETLNQVRGTFLKLFESFPSEDPPCKEVHEAKKRIIEWVDRIRSIDEHLMRFLKTSSAALTLKEIGMEPSVIFGIALSTDCEEQDELSRQLILKYAGLPIVKGKPLTFEALEATLN